MWQLRNPKVHTTQALLNTPSARFHSAAGAFLRHETRRVGAFPAVQVVVTFFYEAGTATYDGRNWEYKLAA